MTLDTDQPSLLPIALIPGCNGQVGTDVCALARQYGFSPAGFGSEALDVTNRDQVHTAINRIKPAIVINCAAYTAVDKAEEEKSRADAVNHLAVRHISEAAKSVAAPVIHLSTDYVFDGTASSPYQTDAKTSPLGVYGETKLAGENALRTLHAAHIILRTAWVYAPHGKNFLKTMLRLGAERETLNVVHDQIGSPTLSRDIAHACLEIARQILIENNQHYGTYHYTSLGAASWYDFAESIFAAMEKETGRRPKINPITTIDYPTPARRPAYSVLNTEQTTKAFGITPPNWQERVGPTVQTVLGNVATS